MSRAKSRSAKRGGARKSYKSKTLKRNAKRTQKRRRQTGGECSCMQKMQGGNAASFTGTPETYTYPYNNKVELSPLSPQNQISARNLIGGKKQRKLRGGALGLSSDLLRGSSSADFLTSFGTTAGSTNASGLLNGVTMGKDAPFPTQTSNLINPNNPPYV